MAAVVISYSVGWVITRRTDDEYARRSVRRAIHFIAFLVALVAVGYVWRLFSTHTSWAFALVAAGFAFALQEMLGAVAGWFNIQLGGIYRIGDRIEVAGVHGDVIDITPIRTKILEIGGGGSDDDWQRAEEIMRDAALEVSPSKEAQTAVDEMRRRYPIPISDLEPRVFIRATDNYMELSARFVIGVRTARVVTDEFTRLVTKQLAEAGIAIASTSMDISLVSDIDRTSRESSRTE